MNNVFYKLSMILKETGIGIKGYLKAQVKCTFITFFILAIGFWYKNIPLYILLALAIAILDIVPVVGSGFIMIPWSLINYFLNNRDLALSISIIYIILTIIRQILEPKIIGDSIGIRPIVTFLSTTLGAIFLGPLGVMFGPIIAIFINAIYIQRKLNI